MPQAVRIVIIGGVAAGPKAAARARRLDPAAEITIVEKDEVISYAGCGLPYYISGVVEDRKSLVASALGVVRDPKFFGASKHITVLTRREAFAIPRDRHELEVRNLQSGEVKLLPYDKLIIATGADPAEPPIPGKDLQNVLRLKQMEHADHFRALMQTESCPSVVIIGGGLIGMEMAEAIVECGRKVTVVEMLPHILTMLDPDMSALVEKHLRQLGVGVMTSTRVERMENDAEGKVTRVVTSAGDVPADLVLLSIGIRPNVSLARAAGLEIGPSGAIKVDERMLTSDPDIYAAGDCAEKLCFIGDTGCFLPLGSVANKEGRVAGSNAVGHVDSFPGICSSTALKVFDWNVARTGLTAAQAQKMGHDVVCATVAGTDRPYYFPGSQPVVLKLVAERGTRRLLGVQGAGPGDVVKRVDVAAVALTAHMTVDQVANLDLTYAPPYSEALDILIHGANTVRNKLDGLVWGLSSVELRDALERGDDLLLLDVRTPPEYAASRIAGSVHIPLGALRDRVRELPRDRRIVIYCKSSLRAYEAARILAGEGFTDLEILDGGLLAWPFEEETGP
jgi:NADPH-dependent 2,4-dienoyl-CoA reductase/sulfur reductase-like enzyme/rhodanese-related sulfurtransferase